MNPMVNKESQLHRWYVVLVAIKDLFIKAEIFAHQCIIDNSSISLSMGTSVPMMAGIPAASTRGTPLINLDMLKLEINTLYDNFKPRSKKRDRSIY
jgi:hypothetical protein